MYACLGVPCHLHFWQNDRDLLRVTAVTRRVERTQNKSQHTKLTLEKKIPPPPLPGFDLATFRSRVRRSYKQAIPVGSRSAFSHLAFCLKLPTRKSAQWRLTNSVNLLYSSVSICLLRKKEKKKRLCRSGGSLFPGPCFRCREKKMPRGITRQFLIPFL